jgi:hypothetical protein
MSVREIYSCAHRAARVIGVGGYSHGAGLRVVAFDKDLGHWESGDFGDTGEGVSVEMASEATCPVHGVKEADDDAAVDFFLDALEAGAAAEEFVEPVLLLANVV